MFHVERVVSVVPPRRWCVFLPLGLVASAQPFWVRCWAYVGAGKGSLVRVLVTWASSSGGALLVLSAMLVDAADVA